MDYRYRSLKKKNWFAVTLTAFLLLQFWKRNYSIISIFSVTYANWFVPHCKSCYKFCLTLLKFLAWEARHSIFGMSIDISSTSYKSSLQMDLLTSLVYCFVRSRCRGTGNDRDRQKGVYGGGHDRVNSPSWSLCQSKRYTKQKILLLVLSIALDIQELSDLWISQKLAKVPLSLMNISSGSMFTMTYVPPLSTGMMPSISHGNWL